MVEACRLDGTAILRDRRTNYLRIWKFGPDERIQIKHIFGDNDTSHAIDGLAKGGHKVGGRVRVEMRNSRHRLSGRLVASKRLQNRVPRKSLSRVHNVTSSFVPGR